MNPEAITAEQTPESGLEARREIIERAREERAEVADSYVSGIFRNLKETYPYKIERAAEFVRTLAPVSDVEALNGIAEESQGLKKMRYKTAAVISALYWQFAAQGKIGAGTSLMTTGALAALRIPELAETSPKAARFVEAASRFLADGKEYLAETTKALVHFTEHNPDELAFDEAESS